MSDIANILDAEETALIAHRDDALELAKRKPTQANLRLFKKAETALNDFRTSRYESSIEDSFTALPAVVTYLDAEGWKISTTTIYEHKDQGKIRPGPDGRFTLSRVIDYANANLQRKDGSSSRDGNLQERKTLEEIRRISSDAAMREMKLKELQGSLISRDHVEVELASRASDLKTHLDASARSSATRIIKMVAGDPQLAPQLISFMLGINRKVMDNYSRPIQGIEEEEA